MPLTCLLFAPPAMGMALAPKHASTARETICEHATHLIPPSKAWVISTMR